MYEGQWRQGKKHGKGKLTWPDGKNYEGRFVDDKPHGLGTFVDPQHDNTETGVWKNGAFVAQKPCK